MADGRNLRLDPHDEMLCVSVGRDPIDDGGTVLPPIIQASLFRQPDMATLFHGLAHESSTSVYSRGTNPTVAVLENVLAELERGEACKCFASGMGAISAVLTGLLDAGDHIVFVGTIYGPTIELAQRLEALGISHTHITSGDIDSLTAAMCPETRMIYMESPGSALFGLLPIAEIVDIANARGAITVLDNSVATPLLQKPIALGVDLVVHSCSKYIGGHSDVLGGAVIGPADLVEQIFRRAFMLLGAVMAPFTAWLLLRGLMTLPTRIARHHADALTVAEYLKNHHRVTRVFHPALNDDDASLFREQMRGHSGLFSFAIDGGFDDAIAVADRLRLFGRAVSWGGPESLVMSGHKADPALHSPTSSLVPASLLRLSVGFEGGDALTGDLEQALA